MTGPPPTAQLSAIVLQPADLPTGWTGTANDPDPAGDAADSAALAQCVGGRNTYPDEIGDSNSDDYALDNASISSEATSFRSPADLTSDIAIIKSPKIDACYDKLAATEVGGSLPAGSTLNSASIVVTPGSAGGPSNVVATAAGRVEVTVGGKVTDLYLNVAFITGPSIEAEIDFTNVATPVPASVRAPLIAKIAARAVAASQV